MTPPTSSAASLNLDDFLDLPPIQDPFLATPPLLTGRLSPLEPRPNERVNLDSPAKGTALTGRQKALAQAQPLSNCVAVDFDPATFKKKGYEGKARSPKPSAPDLEQARKKARLGRNEQIADFVHLPKLLPSKPKAERKAPFRPIGVLNQLNEPPPSAGLFPPITPRTSQTQEGQSQPKVPFRKASGENGTTSSLAEAEKLEGQDAPLQKKKKVYTRERVRWSEEEAEQLVKGVAIYGMGRWKNILEHPDFHFHPARTHVDLKDKFRVLFPPKAPHKWIRSMPKHVSDDEAEASSSPQFRSKTPLRARKRIWTAAEDEQLDKGFRKYGYRWEQMARDKRLDFDNRTGAQIRDRFRLRFPDLYAQQGSSALTELDSAAGNEDSKRSHTEGYVQAQSAGGANTEAITTVNQDDGGTEIDKRSSRRQQALDTSTAPPDQPSLQDSDFFKDDSIQTAMAAHTTSTILPLPAGPDWLSNVLISSVDEYGWPDDPGGGNASSGSGNSSTGTGDGDFDGDGKVAEGEDSLTLPPLTWEDMVPPPMFELT